MKTREIKRELLRELAGYYRDDPTIVGIFNDEDAKKFQVSAVALDAILSDMKDQGLVEFLGYSPEHRAKQWRITVEGLETFEDSEDEDESFIGEASAVSAAIKRLTERLDELEQRVKALGG